MAIPTYDKFYPAIIDFYSDGQPHAKKDVKGHCIEYFHLTEEEINEKLNSGKNVIVDRIGWAITYLSKAGLFERVSKGVYKITAIGIGAFTVGSTCVNNDYLKQFSSYRQFINPTIMEENESVNNGIIPAVEEQPQADTTPDEMIEKAISIINKNLSDDLLEQVSKMNAYKFEDLVVELLEKMGYGKPGLSATTQRSRDGGIDGMVWADRFGLDVVYVQAKRWEPSSRVGLHDIQQFHSALIASQGDAKGVFITTADFTADAKNYVQKLHEKIVLVNGSTLMNLMIEYKLGVSTTKVYEIKRVDSDYFNEDNE